MTKTAVPSLDPKVASICFEALAFYWDNLPALQEPDFELIEDHLALLQKRFAEFTKEIGLRVETERRRRQKIELEKLSDSELLKMRKKLLNIGADVGLRDANGQIDPAFEYFLRPGKPGLSLVLEVLKSRGK